MGMSDAAWPPGPRAAAFIPARLQREYALPHASAAIELKFARRLTERLLASAPQTVVSSPASEADGELRPSPLISHLPPIQAPPSAGTRAYRNQLQAEHGRAAETYLDVRGPALQADAQVRGGAHLLGSQSACPFQAFGTYRLHAERLEEPALGPDALERGSLMHAVLHGVWSELKDHATLAALGGDARRGLVSRCAAVAVTARAAHSRSAAPSNLAAVPSARACRRATAGAGSPCSSPLPSHPPPRRGALARSRRRGWTAPRVHPSPV